MPLASSIPKYRTRVSERRRLGRDVYNVTLHGTMIVSASVYSGPTARQRDGQAIVTLTSGGWRTRTTKRRMNQVLGALGINAVVYQNNFIWYVKTFHVDTDVDADVVLPFYDGMTFTAHHSSNWGGGENLGFGTQRCQVGQRGSMQANPKLPSYSHYVGL